MDILKWWLVSIVPKKMVASAAKLITAFAISHGIKLVAGYHGYPLNIQDEAGLVVLFNTGLKALEHWLATKFPALAWLNGYTA